MGRKPIPPSIEIEVLTQSARRCCICFGLYQNFDVIKGQIAHLDHDNTNNKLDNLAFLCLDCHDEYDSKTSQSKGLTLQEVKRYRKLLYQEITKLRIVRTTQAPASIIDELNQTIETKQAPLQAEIMSQEPLSQSNSSDYPDVLSSEVGKDYRSLRDLLAENDWQTADRETGTLMCEVFGKKDIQNFPIIDLQTIDGLWLKYSHSRFGFSVQRRVLDDTFRDSKVTPETCLTEYQMLKSIEEHSDRLEARWHKFGEKLGWCNQGQLIMSIDYDQNLLNKPEGYLPLLGVAPQRRFLTNLSSMTPWWWLLLLRLKPWES